jgi:hypothetical protein
MIDSYIDPHAKLTNGLPPQTAIQTPSRETFLA